MAFIQSKNGIFSKHFLYFYKDKAMFDCFFPDVLVSGYKEKWEGGEQSEKGNMGAVCKDVLRKIKLRLGNQGRTLWRNCACNHLSSG